LTTHLLITRLSVSTLGLSSTSRLLLNYIALVHGRLLVGLCVIESALPSISKTDFAREHTESGIRVGSRGVNGVFDGGLVLLDGDGALACTADVVIVGGAGGGLGGVFGRHDCEFEYVMLVD